MFKAKVRKIINYIFDDENNLSLEHRILISALIMGIFIGILGGISNIFLTTSFYASLIPLSLTIFAIVLYFIARFKRIYETIAIIAAISGIFGISLVWIFNGGINGPNFMISLVFLLLGLIIVTDKAKKYIISIYILVNIFLFLIQLYLPNIIVTYPTEFDRWIDHLTSLIYSSVCLFLIMRFFHKNYTIERKRAEENQKKLNILNEDKDRFIAVLAHDLKSPFNTLLGFTTLLKKNLYKYDKEIIERQIAHIHRTTQETYNLLEDLLLWSKSQSGNIHIEPQKIVLGEKCNEIIGILKNQADAKEISINCKVSEEIFLFSDLNMLKTILRNLISNAIKFTNRNGNINIYTEKDHKNVIIIVSDNGIGMDNESQSKLWDFTNTVSTTGTADEKGTGFGLILCKEFVEKHYGKIWVESELGKGADFKFTMPLYKE